MSLDQSADSSLTEQLHALRDDTPRCYGLLERYLEDLKQILEQSTRNYASAKQPRPYWGSSLMVRLKGMAATKVYAAMIIERCS